MNRLSLVDRQVIEYFLKLDKSYLRIAEILHRDHTVISREVKRNSGEYLPYNAIRAQHYTERRQEKKNVRKLEKWTNKELREYIITNLEDNLSPEQIAGDLKNNKPLGGLYVCDESIYDYIYNGAGRYERLYKHLRRGRPKRIEWHKRIKHKVIIPERVSIDLRPEEVDQKKRVGDWETDLVVFSKQKAALAVLYERKSQYGILRKVENKQADTFEKTVQEGLAGFPAHSITRDNGGENYRHLETRDSLGVLSFFCNPFCFWQKGGVENLNGLIRQYFPKKHPFDTVTDEEVMAVQRKLNQRPRKNLNYQTPQEVMAQALDVH